MAMQIAPLLAKHNASRCAMQAAYIGLMSERRPYRLWRQKRLQELLREAGGPKALARLADSTDTHLTACEKGRRDIGDELAGSLEVAMGRPAGWMDTDPDAAASRPSSPQTEPLPATVDRARLERLLRDLRAIPLRRLGQLLDQIHEEAELAREAHQHLETHPEPRPEVPSAAARRRPAGADSTSRTRVSVHLGDGNPQQGVLPLTTVADPFTAEPDERERELYERIAGVEKHPK